MTITATARLSALIDSTAGIRDPRAAFLRGDREPHLWPIWEAAYREKYEEIAAMEEMTPQHTQQQEQSK